MTGYEHKVVRVTNNTINLVPTVVAITPQYGIRYNNCVKPFIQLNLVQGTYSSGSTSTGLYGIAGFTNTAATTTCNNVSNFYRGFMFTGAANTHTWGGNRMAGELQGYWLDGAIGPQGSSIFPSDNYWDGVWTGNSMTYVNGFPTFPANSPLFVRSGAAYHPGAPFNGASPFSNRYETAPYTPASMIGFVTSMGSGYGSCWNTAGARTTGEGDTAGTGCVSVYVQAARGMATSDSTSRLARGTGDSSTADPVTDWITQMSVYRAIRGDSTLLDSSAVLTAFFDMAQYRSRYKWLSDIEDSLNGGDFTGASTLMAEGMDATADTMTDSTTGATMEDGTSADGVVTNYLTFYGLYLRFMTDTLSATDSGTLAALAAQCPATGGAAIYEARGMYAAVFGTQGNFQGDCGIDTSGSSSRISSDGQTAGGFNDHGQRYMLYPNPNTGSMTITQYLEDLRPLTLEVVDGTGTTVMSMQTKFTDYALPLNLGRLAPGVYLLHITNAEGHSFNLKFVAE